MSWFRRKAPEPAPEAPGQSSTPIADAVLKMFEAGRAWGDIVSRIRELEIWTELERVRAENLRLRVELNWRAADLADAAARAPKGRSRATSRATRRATKVAPRKRAKYFRDYRARNKLRLVRNHGDDAA